VLLIDQQLRSSMTSQLDQSISVHPSTLNVLLIDQQLHSFVASQFNRSISAHQNSHNTCRHPPAAALFCSLSIQSVGFGPSKYINHAVDRSAAAIITVSSHGIQPPRQIVELCHINIKSKLIQSHLTLGQKLPLSGSSRIIPLITAISRESATNIILVNSSLKRTTEQPLYIKLKTFRSALPNTPTLRLYHNPYIQRLYGAMMTPSGYSAPWGEKGLVSLTSISKL
jgi:hypothetical protein